MSSVPVVSQIHGSKPPSVSTRSDLTFLHNAVRDHLTIPTWLLVGASLQCLLLLLPIRAPYLRNLALLLLCIKATDTVLVILGLKRNTYMDGTITHNVTAIYPVQSTSDKPRSNASTGAVAVLLLGFRSNHPLGMFAPAASTLRSYFTDMRADLEANASSNGFLGVSPFLDAGHRTTSSTLMLNFYFRAAADIHAFAHGPVHRAGWDWWNKFVKEHKYLAIMHEVYEAPAGAWESIYFGFEPMGFGATTHLMPGREGKEEWVSPLVDASRGRLRTHRGRLGLSKGNDHDIGLGGGQCSKSV